MFFPEIDCFFIAMLADKPGVVKTSTVRIF